MFSVNYRNSVKDSEAFVRKSHTVPNEAVYRERDRQTDHIPGTTVSAEKV
jgi:hypothetical protein